MPKVDFKKIKALQHFKHEMPDELKKIVGGGLNHPTPKPFQLHPELQKMMPRLAPPLAQSAGMIPHHGAALEAPPAQPQNTPPGTVNTPNQADPTGQTQLTVVRHGSTAMNEKKVNRGHVEIPLSTQGKAQANKVGAELKKKSPDFLVSSDLGRAKETARTIAGILRIPIQEVTKALRPWDIGSYSGKDIMASLPTLQDHMRNKPDEKLPGGESFNTFKERTLTALDKLIKDNPGKHIGLISHHRVERLVEAWLKSDTGTADHDISVGHMMVEGAPPGSATTHTV